VILGLGAETERVPLAPIQGDRWSQRLEGVSSGLPYGCSAWRTCTTSGCNMTGIVPSALSVGTSNRSGSTAGPGAGPERLPGPELGSEHQSGHPMAADVTLGSPQLLVDPRGSVDGAILLEHHLDLSGQSGVFGHKLSRRLLPLPPCVVATAGHAQLPAQPGDGVLLGQLIDQANPLGGSCSLAKCAAASLKKSFSLLSSRFSLRSRLSSARSSLASRP
jgi:hypothetical protein